MPAVPGGLQRESVIIGGEKEEGGMKYKEKVGKVLAFSGWTQDRMADLMGVGNMALNKWARGKREPRGRHAEVIDAIYAELVEPYVCELEAKADEVAKRMLEGQIRALPDDNVCEK